MQEQWLQCNAVRQLQKNLGQERSAVFTFYYTFCDEVRGALAQHLILDCAFLHSPAIASGSFHPLHAFCIGPRTQRFGARETNCPA